VFDVVYVEGGFYCLWELRGMGWDGNRLYDADSGSMEADRSLDFGRVGLMVWSLGILVWLGLVFRCFGFSTGAGGFVCLVFFLFDAATLGLDWNSLVHIPACIRLLFSPFSFVCVRERERLDETLNSIIVVTYCVP
jgi:hypothetical protein